MHLLTHLFTVATDPSARPGDITRTPLVAWTYQQVFHAIVRGTTTTLVFKDIDAWVESPGMQPDRKTSQGDTADLAMRLMFADIELGDLFGIRPGKPLPTGTNGRYQVPRPNHITDTDLSRLRERLTLAGLGIGTNADLCAPENVGRVRAILDAWIAAGPSIRPFGETGADRRREEPTNAISA